MTGFHRTIFNVLRFLRDKKNIYICWSMVPLVQKRFCSTVFSGMYLF